MGYVLIFWVVVTGSSPGMTNIHFPTEDACQSALQVLTQYGPHAINESGRGGVCLSLAKGLPPGAR